ncbi:hypothetical protein TTHERM_01179830 (macronuclear) [Tetrahymena thermophila SB210]|uniref:Uncharacterized protein n=1 Tax=Tetrahymena thermophila (strain SB210) TaxID=312017 RepID=Q22AP2_TETTS|nr:hypothetical protein TTHERM_01179830 [Tetrahymena thermophila SB210]EAR82352.1 hypothetical protein TTHERM_01179830 [Tetrahymena thermophila SB210]|eukprot:XP_001030015.1 hypothetical protein TTHERM_01179830 [Tetrahymena thermophila SB210]
MNSEYYGDSQFQVRKTSFSGQYINSTLSTPKNQRKATSENQNENFNQQTLSMKNILQEKRKSIFCKDYNNSNLANEIQKLRQQHAKNKSEDKLCYLSIMRRANLDSAQNKKRTNSNVNQSNSQNENDNQSEMNNSFSKHPQIYQLNSYRRISSFFNQNENEANQANKSKNQKQNPENKELNKLFQSMLDVYDKDTINRTIQKVSDPKQRQKIIDMIIKRREEIKNAQQLVQMSKHSLLVNRFLKKVMKDENQIVVNAKDNYQKQSSLNQLDTPDNASVQDSNDNQQKDTISFTLLNQQYQQQNCDDVEVNQFKNERKPTFLDNSFSQEAQIQTSNRNSNDQRRQLIAKGIAFTAFMKNKDGFKKFLGLNNDTANNNEQNKTDRMQSASQEKMNLSIDEQDQNKFSRKGSTKLSLITKDNLFKSNLPAHILPGSVDAKLFQIDLNSISEKSKLLVEKGQETNRNKANELLKDYQKLYLASHFKSKSVNQSNFNNSDINTFNYRRIIHKKKIDSKIQSLTPQQKEQFKCLNKFLTYREPKEVLNEVKEDVAAFISKKQNSLQSQENLDFFMPKQQYKFTEVKKIDREAMESLKEFETKKKNKSNKAFKSQTLSSIHNMPPLSSKFEKDVQKNLISQQSTLHHLDYKPCNSTEDLNSQASNSKRGATFSQHSMNQILSSTTNNSQTKQANKISSSQPYFSDFYNNKPNSTIDKHIYKELEVKKNNYKPSPSFKERSVNLNNPIQNYIQNQMEVQSSLLNPYFANHQQSLYNKSTENLENNASLQSLNQSQGLSKSTRSIHVNKISSYSNTNRSSRDLSKKYSNKNQRNNSLKSSNENEDLFHNTKELNDSLSFASFTEIKLDQLYKQTKKIKKKIKYLESCQHNSLHQNFHKPNNDIKIDTQMQYSEKDLTHAERQIQDTNFRKLKN